jgi:hypothetical protein
VKKTMPFSKGKLLKLNPNFKIFRASRGSKSGSGAYAKVNFNFPCPKGTFFLARGLFFSVKKKLFGVKKKPYRYVLSHGLYFELYQGFLVLGFFELIFFFDFSTKNMFRRFYLVEPGLKIVVDKNGHVPDKNTFFLSKTAALRALSEYLAPVN